MVLPLRNVLTFGDALPAAAVCPPVKQVLLALATLTNAASDNEEGEKHDPLFHACCNLCTERGRGREVERSRGREVERERPTQRYRQRDKQRDRHRHALVVANTGRPWSV